MSKNPSSAPVRTRPAASPSVFLALLLPLACGTPDLGAELSSADGGAASEDLSDVQAAQEALFGRVDDDGRQEGLCTPFALNMLDRISHVAGAAVSTQAVADCVQGRLADVNIPCPADPLWDRPTAERASALIRAIRIGNHLQPRCALNAPTDAAGNQGPFGESTRETTFSQWYTREQFDLYTDGVTGPGNPEAPLPLFWSNLVGAMPHELLHTHGFTHADSRAVSDCYWPTTTAAACALPDCAWVDRCDPMDLIPPPMGSPDATRADLQNHCSVRAGFGDDEMARRGQLPAHYPMQAVDSCVVDLALQSSSSCGPMFGNPACPNADDTRLLSAYVASVAGVTGAGTSRSYTDGFGGACVCVPSQRHEVSLIAHDGMHRLNAGGAVVNALATATGPSETFHIIDRNGGALMDGDRVSIRLDTSDTFLGTNAGGTLRSDYTDGGALAATFTIHRDSGGVITPGTRIYLRSLLTGFHVTASAGGGGGVTVLQPSRGAWERFTLIEPRRTSLIHLRTHDGRYVSYDQQSSTQLETRLKAAEYSTDPSGAMVGSPFLREQAFWLVDHNGGQLHSFDLVSLGSSEGRYRRFWHTCSSGTTGNVRGDAWHQTSACQQFYILRASGSGPIVHGTPVALFSAADFRYLAAVPSGNPNAFRIRNERSGSVGAWETFVFELPQEGRF